MSRLVNDQVVVITGASSGVGRACAQAFGAAGAKVALIARNEEALQRAAQEIRHAGGEAMVLPLDVANSDAVEDAAARVEAEWGRIDTWLNDAMVTVFSPAMQMAMEDYRRVTEVNYLGFVYGTMAALRRMVPRDEGTVIQISSALAFRAIPLQSAYCGSKAAIHLFSDSVRTELLHEGSKVRISELILPAVNTPQFEHSKSRMPRKAQPVPPIYQPELIAEAAIYAAEHYVREMVIGGGALKAVIGQKFIPGLLDHYLARTCYEAQMTDQPSDPDRPNNLFAPVSGDPGAHGSFDSRSKSRSLQLWLRMHETMLVLAAATGAAAGIAATRDTGLAGTLAGSKLGRRAGLAAAKQAAQHPGGLTHMLLAAARANSAAQQAGGKLRAGLRAADSGKLAAGAGVARQGFDAALSSDPARQTVTLAKQAFDAAKGATQEAGGGLRKVWEDVREGLPIARD